MKRNIMTVGLALLASAAAAPAFAAGKYVVGVSNTLIGNGWREEMICSVKAQAEASGMVSKVIVANRNGGPAEQISDLRNLISAGVNAIILDPSDREALNPIIKQAVAKGIVVVSVDQDVSAPDAYNLSNDQVSYGKLGAEWLFKHLNGKGNVVEMRGIDGVPGDADRHQGFSEALKAYPDIKVVAAPFTGKAAQQAKDLLGSGKDIDGIWTSGQDSVVVDAVQTAGKKMIPVIGADTNGFIGQMIELKDKGFVSAAVTNPPTVGGAGVALALGVLEKKGDLPKTVKISPEVWDNTTAENIDKLKQYHDPKLDPYYSMAFQIPPYTTYTKEQLLACKGP